MTLKKKIADSFSRYAGSYDEYAEVQKAGATELVGMLRRIVPGLPPGPVLEIGCGTGIISRELVSLLPGREIELSDVSPGMLEKCRENISHAGLDRAGVKWRILDGEKVYDHRRYALIISGFTFQWFSDPPQASCRLYDALVPGGALLVSFQGADSFPEWRRVCDNLGLPYTGNPLPSEKMIENGLKKKNAEVTVHQRLYPVKYMSSMFFFKSLKRIGAATVMSTASLTPSEMRRLITAWDAGGKDVTVSWQVYFLKCLKREEL